MKVPKVPIDVSMNISQDQWNLLIKESKNILEQLEWYKCIIPRIIWRIKLEEKTISQYKWFHKLYKKIKVHKIKGVTK